VSEPETSEFEPSKIENEKNKVGGNKKEAIIHEDPVKTCVDGTHSHNTILLAEIIVIVPHSHDFLILVFS
jgi:hypothetical protein